MDRQLLSKILAQMRKNLKDGKSIGDMKVGALLALGHQLEAIFYYLGHELGTILNVEPVDDMTKVAERLQKVINEFKNKMIIGFYSEYEQKYLEELEKLKN